MDLAADFHGYYNAERVLVDDDGVRNARMALLLAIRQVLRNGLSMLGVSAPEKMCARRPIACTSRDFRWLRRLAAVRPTPCKLHP